MPETLVEQIQIDNANSYNDGLTPANAESSAITLDDDLNYIRSQMLVLLGSDQSNWFDAPTEDLTTLAARQSLEATYMIRRRQVLTDVTVPASQNYVVLSVAGSEAPTRPIAIGATTEGAISAQLAGAAGSHDLAEVAGVSALFPKNLIHIQDGTTGDAIMSSNRQVYALLQVASTATDGNNFADSNDIGQLSFVRPNATYTDLEACPVADIEGKDIVYSYADRTTIANSTEQDFDPGHVFVDQAGSVDVTLQNAITNQSGAVTQGSKDIDVQLSDTYKWQFSESGGDNILSVNAASGGDNVLVGSGTNAATFKGFGTGEFVDSLAVDTGGQTINIGNTAGQIDSTSITVVSSTGNISLDSAGELYFADSRQTTALPLTDASNASLTGGPYASLFAAINAAATSGGFSRADANTTGAVSANTLIAGPGAVATQNLSADLVDYTGKTFVDDVIIFINGVYQRPGADAAANNDVYPATVAGDIAAGAFYCEKNVKTNANIMMLVK